MLCTSFILDAPIIMANINPQRPVSGTTPRSNEGEGEGDAPKPAIKVTSVIIDSGKYYETMATTHKDKVESTVQSGRVSLTAIVIDKRTSDKKLDLGW